MPWTRQPIYLERAHNLIYIHSKYVMSFFQVNWIHKCALQYLCTSYFFGEVLNYKIGGLSLLYVVIPWKVCLRFTKTYNCSMPLTEMKKKDKYLEDILDILRYSATNKNTNCQMLKYHHAFSLPVLKEWKENTNKMGYCTSQNSNISQWIKLRKEIHRGKERWRILTKIHEGEIKRNQ